MDKNGQRWPVHSWIDPRSSQPRMPLQPIILWTQLNLPQRSIAKKPPPCMGMAKKLIYELWVNCREDTIVGSDKLVGNAVRFRASHISNNGTWDFGEAVEGHLLDPQRNSVSWECMRLSCLNPAYYGYILCRTGCEGSAANNNYQRIGCCWWCYAGHFQIIRSCQREINDMKKKPANFLQGVRVNTLGIRLPSLVVPVLKDKAHKLDLRRRKVRYRDRTIEKLRRIERPIPSLNAKQYSTNQTRTSSLPTRS